MVKFIVALLTVYLLLLNIFPCPEEVFSFEDESAVVATTHSSDSNEEDDCPPYCDCACCAVQLMRVCNCVHIKTPVQFAVFHPAGPSYRSLFPVEPSSQEIPACDEVGVLGVLPGIIGLLQAKEAIFYLAGFESPAQQGLMTFDLRDMRLSSFRL